MGVGVFSPFAGLIQVRVPEVRGPQVCGSRLKFVARFCAVMSMRILVAMFQNARSKLVPP